MLLLLLERHLCMEISSSRRGLFHRKLNSTLPSSDTLLKGLSTYFKWIFTPRVSWSIHIFTIKTFVHEEQWGRYRRFSNRQIHHFLIRWSFNDGHLKLSLFNNQHVFWVNMYLLFCSCKKESILKNVMFLSLYKSYENCINNVISPFTIDQMISDF